jgi:hypothetical protein
MAVEAEKVIGCMQIVVLRQVRWHRHEPSAAGATACGMRRISRADYAADAAQMSQGTVSAYGA